MRERPRMGRVEYVSALLRGEGRMTYQVWDHAVQVSVVKGWWTVAVDEMLFEKLFASEAEAWEAGVREISHLESAASQLAPVRFLNRASSLRN